MDQEVEKQRSEQEVLKLSTLLVAQHRPEGVLRRVQVIINPAAGKDQPILKVLNAAFRPAGIDWDVVITKEAGDGRRLAEEAVKAGADAVVVHGGDGTVMEVASGLVGSDTPLAIIPGGTANVLSRELNIPVDLVEACSLIINPDALVRKIDVGKLDDHFFVLRAGMGFEADMVEGADRDLKDRMWLLAYTFSAMQALAEPTIARYRITLDGKLVETEGLTCMIANSGNVGTPGITLHPAINISDGLLDVIVVTKADLPSLVALVASVVGKSESPNTLQHWQARQVTVESDPPQNVQLDGEMVGSTPVSASLIPHAIRVIVPAVVDATP